jgi:uncharacterized protein (TIGR03083 family)
MNAPGEHDRVGEILGAWALDACSPEENRLVAAHLAECEPCAAEARLLRATATELATGSPAPGTQAPLASPSPAVEAGRQPHPPPSLRAAVLAAAFARRRPDIPAAVAPYAAQVRALDRVLDALSPADWQTKVIRDWSVHDMLAHLAALDGLLAAHLGLAEAVLPLPPSTPDPSTRDGATIDTIGDGAGTDRPSGRLRRRTADVLAWTRGQEPARTRAAWRAQAAATIAVVAAAGADLLTTRVDYGGAKWRVDQVLLARAFETWIHTDDIRGALGMPAASPAPEHLDQLADAAMRVLERRMVAGRVGHPGRAARVELHGGASGGEWTVQLGPGQPTATPDVTLRLDMLEFCYLIGGRRDLAGIHYDVTGDHGLATDLLSVAAGFARE